MAKPRKRIKRSRHFWLARALSNTRRVEHQLVDQDLTTDPNDIDSVAQEVEREQLVAASRILTGETPMRRWI